MLTALHQFRVLVIQIDKWSDRLTIMYTSIPFILYDTIIATTIAATSASASRTESAITKSGTDRDTFSSTQEIERASPVTITFDGDYKFKGI